MLSPSHVHISVFATALSSFIKPPSVVTQRRPVSQYPEARYMSDNILGPRRLIPAVDIIFRVPPGRIMQL